MEFFRTLKRYFFPLAIKDENPTSQQTPSESLASSVTATGSHNLAAGRDIHNPNISTLQVTGMSSEQVNANTINVVVNTPGEKPKEVNTFRLIDAPIPNFVGREELISKIHSLLTLCAEKTQWLERTVIIQGLGGMGKTELVRKYVQLHINDPIIQNVAWIDSETKKSLEKSFKKIARKFKLDIEGLDVEEIAESVYEHFSENFEAGLFIFDNVVQLRGKEPYLGILNYLPIQQQERLPLILITTRTKEWERPQGSGSIIDISELSEEQSVQLLNGKISLNDIQRMDSEIQAAIWNLAQVIQGFPLGLTLAAANIDCSTSVNIAEEIQNYTARLDIPKSGWIDDEHSTGFAGKYNLVISNVWKATFEKIESMGVKGKCALTLLNIMAFLPTDYTEKSLVDEILEFGYLSLKDYIKDGYKYLETFSLITLLKTETVDRDFLIQIHRHVQRCTRERLDSVEDHSFLLNIARYLCEKDKFDQVECIKIHRHLKLRKWPQFALRYSIIFLSRYYNNDEFADELVTDLSEATEATANNYSVALGEGYRTLLGLSLYLFSEKKVYDDDEEDGGAANLRKQWREKYTEAFSASMKILAHVFTNKYYIHVRSTCTEVQQRVTDVFEDILDAKNQFKRICIKNPDSRSKNVGQAVTRPLHSQIISKINEALNIYDPNYVDQNAILGFKVALKLYLLIYSSSSGGQELPARGPIDYNRLRNALKESKEKRTNSSVASHWEKSILDAILNHGGLHVVQQDLSCTADSRHLKEVVGFSFILVTKYGCSEEFKKTPYFLQTLKEKIAFEHEELQQWYSLLWLALFPPNCTFLDIEGNEWSINSVADQMKPRVNYTKDFKMFWQNILGIYEDEVVSVLLPHLELSKSESLDDLGFKNAVAAIIDNATDRSGWVDSLMQATLDKIGSMGVKGKCALTMLKILDFLPTDILKSRVDEILDFGVSPIKDYVAEGYNILKSTSLIKEQSKYKDFKICVYGPAQLCIRERIDCVDDLCVLLSIVRFLRQINSEDIPILIQSIEPIHNYLKQRKWPKESLRFSITMMSWYYRDQIYSKFALELAKDLSEAIEADDEDYLGSLQGGYETLLGMLLHVVSEKISDKNDVVTASLLRRWSGKYQDAFDASLKIFTSALFVMDSLLPINTEVQQLITCFMEHFVRNYYTLKRIRIQIRDSVAKAADETITLPQDSHNVSTIYFALGFYAADEPNLNSAIALKSALQLHIQLFTNNSSLLDREYWNRCAISYSNLKKALNESKRNRTDPSIATDWEKSIVDAFLAHGGPQAAQQSLSFIDYRYYLHNVIDFIVFLVTKYNCKDAFKETPSFLHSLLGQTAASRKGGKHTYLLLWLALFPPNSAVEDNKGRKWSLDSVADQMNEFLADYWKWTDSELYFNLDEDVLIKTLLPHLDLSGSEEQQDLHFKTAVALMNGNIEHRHRRYISRSRGWEAVFKTHFITQHNTQPEILEIGKKHFNFLFSDSSLDCA